MTFKHIAAVAVGFGLLMACEDGGKPPTTTDTADTGGPGTPTPIGPAFISVVTSGCLETGDGIFIEFETDNLAYEPIVYIFDTRYDSPAAGSVWDEEHPLGVTHHIANDPNGAWDQWGVDLTAVASAGAVNPGSTTLFGCSYYNEDAITYVVEVADDAGTVVDCGVCGGTAPTR